jgi:hypothetical protein
MVLQSSRHPITEAGFDSIMIQLERSLKSTEPVNGPHGTISYGGLEDPGQLGRPCHKLVRVTPAGETWVVYIDPKTKFPAMVQATGPHDELLERYRFDDPKLDLPDLASNNAFDPSQRWGQPKGILQRLARTSSTKLDSESATR